MDRLRERVNVKYGLDLGEPCTTDPTLFGAYGLHSHPCTRSTFSAVHRCILLACLPSSPGVKFWRQSKSTN